MTMDSAESRHWTDDELIDHIYGVGPEDGHLKACSGCRSRLGGMEARRAIGVDAGEVSHDFLLTQRRCIYARIATPVRWWRNFHLRGWASALATGSLLVAGILYYENTQQQNQATDQLSDAQLAQEVTSMAQSSEPSPTAPLEALFEQ
jgi:hypothetical protein